MNSRELALMQEVEDMQIRTTYLETVLRLNHEYPYDWTDKDTIQNLCNSLRYNTGEIERCVKNVLEWERDKVAGLYDDDDGDDDE